MLQRALYFAAKLDTDLHFIRNTFPYFFFPPIRRRGSLRGEGGGEKIHRFLSTRPSIRRVERARIVSSTRRGKSTWKGSKSWKEGRTGV